MKDNDSPALDFWVRKTPMPVRALGGLLTCPDADLAVCPYDLAEPLKRVRERLREQVDPHCALSSW